jgi:AbrB family looped-hinge helix DNA binding protein
MITTINSKGQVTIPKQIRDALKLEPGCPVRISINQEGEVVVQKIGACASCEPDCFDLARGMADIKWRTEDLMVLLRTE